MSTEDGLTAEEVASKEFPVGFRGFGQHDVRAFLAQVAAELAAARERERLQRQRLEAAEARAAARTLSEEEIEAALGEGASKLLHVAGEAAAEIRSKAEEEAARLVREATAKQAAASREAESLLGERSREAEKLAADIVAEARSEAAAQVEAAKAEGRAMVAEAQAVRERILKDLVRRRRVAHQQLEQLRAGRERLLEAYRVVRSTLDEATRELGVAEAEARAAAETAALRAGARPDPSIAEIESELSAARDAGLTVASSGPGDRRGAEANGNGSAAAQEATPVELDDEGHGPDAVVDVSGADPEPMDELGEGFLRFRPAEPEEWSGAGGSAVPDPVGTVSPDEVAEALADTVEPAGEQRPLGPGSVEAGPSSAEVVEPDDGGPEAEPVVEVAEPVGEVAEAGGELAEPVVEGARPGAEPDDAGGSAPPVAEPEPEVATPGSATGPQARPEPILGEAPPQPVTPEPVEPVVAAPAPERAPAMARAPGRASPQPVAPATARPVAPQSPPPPESEIERLFARIRADREATVARAEAVLSDQTAGPGGPDPAAPVDSERADGKPSGSAVDADQGPSADSHPDGAEVAAASFGAAVDDEHVLQERDAQIEPLERVLLRSLKRALADEQNEVLDTLRRHRGGWALSDLLPEPADHVDRFVAVVGGDLEAAAIQGARSAGGGDAPPVDELARALASEVTDDLRSRLQRAVDAADGDEAPLRDGISSAYREWKTSWAQPLVRHHVAAAHARGRFAAVPDVALRWVVDDDEGPCPDCDDNALAGPTPKGEPFPTGQEHPPAHVGCRCMVVPEPA